jgi:hypothetical protein
VASSSGATPSFQEQADAYARGLSLTVDWVSEAQLDEDPAREHLARLCDPQDASSGGLYVLEQAPGVLWSVSSLSTHGACPSTPPGKEPLPTSLSLSVDEYRVWASGDLAFREGRPVLLHSSEGGASGPSVDQGPGTYSSSENWDRLTFSAGTSGSDAEGNPRETGSGGAIVPVLASPKAAATLPPTFNQVTSGRKWWTGEKDASVRVAALARSTSHVRLRVQVRDDVALPAAKDMSDWALLGTDHLEIWWARNNIADTPARQLAVARTGEGGVLARWLHPEGLTEPLPEVALDGDTLLVDLPLASLGVTAPEAAWQVAFTVAFSDADEAGVGQQTLVATSGLRWNAPHTFGRLVSFPGHTRYPPEDGFPWDRVVYEPPRRLELTDAGLPVVPAAQPAPEPPPSAEQPEPTSPPPATAEVRPPEPKWREQTRMWLPFIIGSILFFAAVAATPRHTASRAILVVGGILTALAAVVPFTLSFDKKPDALSGLILLPVLFVSTPVFITIAVLLTLRLSRTPGRNRVWLAAGVAALFLMALSAWPRFS